MKYIYNYTELFLNESFNSKEAKKKFLTSGLISSKDFNIIKKAFLPKYVYWGCREKSRPENSTVILDSIYDSTLWFGKNKQYLKSKDIYSYSFDEIRLFMNDPSIGPKKKRAKGKGKYKIEYEDDLGNILVRVDDHIASVYWAHKYREGEIPDGQWCTASYNDDSNFISYSTSGPIYILILPHEEEEEYKRLCAVNYELMEAGEPQPLDNYDIIEVKTNQKTTFGIDSVKNTYDYSFYNSEDISEDGLLDNLVSLPKKIKNFFTKINNTKIDISKILNIKDITIKDINFNELLCVHGARDYYTGFGAIGGPNREGEDTYSFYSEGPLQKEIVKYVDDNIIYLPETGLFEYSKYNEDLEKTFTYEEAKKFIEEYKDYKYCYSLIYSEFFISKIKIDTKNFKYNINSNEGDARSRRGFYSVVPTIVPCTVDKYYDEIFPLRNKPLI